MQRLFSTFANGLPGLGLMLQRILCASLLWSRVLTDLHTPLMVGTAGPQFFDAFTGMLILIGLWTPVLGAIIASRALWILCSDSSDPWMSIVLSTLGASLAMIGPGAWSLDARLFGRRQIRSLR